MGSFTGGEATRGGQAMSKTILIVEDNELNMKLLDNILRMQGYKTAKSADGSDAVDLTRSERPDLILMDIQLPGSSGLDITRTLKADDDLKHIPMLAVTSFAMEGDRERILESGCDGYIPKPITINGFLETVARHLSTPGLRAPLGVC